MSRFLICTLPLSGHVNPGLPIARALIERGHEVWWYTGRKFRSAIEAEGAHHAPMQAAHDPEGDDFFPRLPKLSGLAAANWSIKRAFIDPIPSQVADLRRILAEFPADVLISDQVFAGAEAVHELGGPPWAMLGISVLTLSSRDTAPAHTTQPPDASPLGRLRNQVLHALINRVVLRDAVNHANYVRWTLGLPPLRRGLFDMVSPFLYMHPSTPAFEYPRSDLPPQVHFIGPLLPEPPADFRPPAWWDELHAGRPVIHVTQGTVATDPNDLIVPTLRALEGEEVLVVATTGGQPVESVRIERLPSNARLERFLPHARLLPHVDVMITNGGYGGVQFALAHGVPLVVAGGTEEKPQIAARIAWSGAGINLKTGKPTREQIRAAVREALDTPRYRHNARRIQADYAQHNAPQEAADLLERLAATRQPVLREALVRLAPLPAAREAAGV
jgi:MGT family glycosyltransferase